VVGTLEEHREVIDVSSRLPRWDPRWEFVDGAGHFHARDRAGFPTLAEHSEHVECDGSCGGDAPCEGYGRTTYSCSIWIPGLASWDATVEASIPAGRRVTIRIDDGKLVVFGVAESAGQSASRGVGDAEPVVTTRLVGVSDLGRMERARERGSAA
jgi:hypothetical protein